MARVKLNAVAPGRFVPSLRHWQPKGGVPSAWTVNMAVVPIVFVWLTGWLTMDGAAKLATVSTSEAEAL